MRRFATIMESTTPPPTNSIWVNKGKLKYFSNGKWREFQPSIDLSDYTNAVQITYSELKSLRDAGKLVPGQQYRITDYTCTTTQDGTKSAGHVFDIIVTADDESTLNEVARAVKHDGDTYFTNSDLSAWKIWYCLDNDTTRFAWADATNGKGVIYRMIDEFGNDCPYDFKNIQFYRQWDSSKSLWSTISSDNTGVPCYTFSSKGNSATISFTDMSLSISNEVHSNVIGEYVSSQKQTLNNICFFGNYCYSNTFGNNCCYNTFRNNCKYNAFGNSCVSNTFGNNCYSNTFRDDCDSNTFGNYCYNNTFGNDCDNNTFGNYCYSNTFGNNCYYSTFGNYCHSNTFGNDFGLRGNNTFGNDCYSNIFGDACSSNTFGNSCSYNTFGNNCGSNTFGNSCDSNTFIDDCSSNTFGNRCSYNTFGNSCDSNTFGNDCYSNTFGNYCSDIKLASDASATTKYNYYQHNHFGDGCQYIVFTGTEIASGPQQVQNYNFAQGVRGTSSAYLTIDGVRNRAYETYISRDTDGTIKESVIAEKLDKVIEIRYNDLVTLRGSSKLIPGQQYRITDYTCTTTQTGTKSAGHVFDIIVTADDESTLNEEARAALHSGDEYFSGCSLNAWQIWYCLDNDTNRFAWADATNGKGVIYRMIDEWNNDVPYDFKNIQFKRYILDANNAIATDVAKDGELNAVKEKLKVMSHRTHTSLWYYGSYVSDVYPAADENTKYVPFGDVFYNGDGPGVLCPINEENFGWFYTFSDNSFNDVTLTIQGYVYNNVIKSNKQLLLIIDGVGRYSFEEQENICLNDIIFIGNICNSNSFGNDCNSNSLGNDCISNSFGNYCYSNSFRNSCYYNSFGNDYYSNSFGNNCYFNSFGNNCYSNSFGNDYYSNSFGNDCYYNSFGNNCYSNSFGNNCNDIKFASSTSESTKYNYYQYNHFGDGCKYLLFKGAETASSSSQVQNYNFAQGLQGTSSAYIEIDGVRSRAYETKVAKNSTGEVKTYCEADLIL